MNGIDRKQEDADIKSVQENPGYFRDLPSERKTDRRSLGCRRSLSGGKFSFFPEME